MVKKEIDVSVLKKLNDKHVGFLPYVSDASLRSQLRHDIQAIQTPEWNDKNYDQLLPRVVAEIWHYYSDRKIRQATLEEHDKRLQLELELENLKKNESGEIFSKSEQADFNFIWNKYDRYERVNFSKIDNKSQVGDKNFCEIEISLQPSLSIMSVFKSGFHEYFPTQILVDIVRENFPEEGNNLHAHKNLISIGDLLKFGLLVRSHKTETRTIYTFSDKFRRFEYWLEYTGKMPQEFKYRLFQKDQPPIESTYSIEKIRKKYS